VNNTNELKMMNRHALQTRAR